MDQKLSAPALVERVPNSEWIHARLVEALDALAGTGNEREESYARLEVGIVELLDLAIAERDWRLVEGARQTLVSSLFSRAGWEPPSVDDVGAPSARKRVPHRG